MSDKKRLINDLRVIDLRAELDKRSLDKTGVRAVLLKRLAQFLKDEGHDPDTFEFEPLGAESRTPSKRARNESNADAEGESLAEGDAEGEEGMLDVRVEDMIVQDDVGDEDEVEEETGKKEELNTTKELVPSEPMETDKLAEVPQSRKRELKDEPQATEAKKPCLEEAKPQQKVEEPKVELNNTDAEDSINLDIGEDELLNDDTDSTAKAQKEEGSGGGGAGKQAAATTGASTVTSGSADKQEEQQAKSVNNTTSETTDDKKDKDDKVTKGDTEAGDKKDEGKDTGTNAARNLWVSGLSGDTRAKDLKQLCSKHGKVIGAKVVTNARTPGSRCYGYVTMSSAQDAENCIKNLHRTELHGRMISVEKAKSEASGGGPVSSRRRERRHSSKDGKEENAEGKKEGEENGEAKPEAEGEEKPQGSRSQSKDKAKSEKGSAVVKGRRERSRERKRSPRDALSFNKIWKERDAARARERSRLARDEERRRRQAEEELRQRERQQRDENRRLAHERHKLRLERERIDREKKELLRLERERHKLEREKLELERLELKRAQLRLEEERRKRAYEASAPGYRKPTSPPPPPPYERDSRHKRAPPPPLSSSRGAFEAPPPPRFEMATPAYERSADKRGDRGGDYKRDYNPRSHISSSSVKYPANGTSADDSRQTMTSGGRPKEPASHSSNLQTRQPINNFFNDSAKKSRAGYEARDSRGGAAYRSPPTGKPEPRTWTSSSRYPDSAPATKDYNERSSGSSWTGGASKSYPSSRHPQSAPSASQSWTKPGTGSGTNESWQSSSAAGDSRYGSSYEARSYSSTYQPPPPGAAPYVDRYQPAPTRDYRQKY